MRLKIQNQTQYVKDTESKAVLNTDSLALNAYKKQREFLTKNSNAADEINNLKNEVAEIKQMLVQLLNRST